MRDSLVILAISETVNKKRNIGAKRNKWTLKLMRARIVTR